MTNVLIVEDERLVSEMLCLYVQSASDRYRIVRAIRNADDAMMFCMKTQVDLILMDICTIGDSSGIEAAARIKEKYPDIRIIIVTSAPDYRFLDKARRSGIESFWYKDIGEDELVSIMDRTMNGENVYPDSPPVIQIGLAKSTELTKKELETLYWLAKLGDISSIAAQMKITTNGVQKHLRDLKEKTGIKSTTQLAVTAASSRLVLPQF